MSFSRRLTAVFAAAALGWGGLAMGVGSPAAQSAVTTADSTPHDLATYYVGTEGLTGTALATKLHTIIVGHTRLTYAQLWTALVVTDADPNNTSTSITDFYAGTSLLKTAMCNHSGSCAGEWNREHSWAKSHGDFGTATGPGTDLFHMRPELSDVNSSRSNLDFDNGGSATITNCPACKKDSDSFEPRAAIKGDVARGLFYMAVRYDGGDGFPDLVMNDFTCNAKYKSPNHGKLSTLVAWSQADPPDDVERSRNDVIDGSYQHNRNPFIDHPEWVTAIWGNGVGQGPACGTTGGGDPGGNRAPTTSPMSGSTAEDTAASVTLSANDPDGDPLTWSVSQNPAHGSASVAGSTLTYTPTPDYNGGDQIGVTVSDGRGGVANTTLSITVTPVNDAPIAFNVTASTPLDASRQIDLSGADVDDTALSFAIATQPGHGTVSVSGSTATYTPTNGYAGSDTFTYTASDGRLTSAPATVSITVTSNQQAPTATDTSATTAEDEAVTVTLPASDPGSAPLTLAIGTQPAHGSVSLSGDQATYTPGPDYHGSDEFTFTASNGTSTSDSATVTLTVTPVNDAPVATPKDATTLEDTGASMTLSGKDVDGDALTYAIATQPEHGTLRLSGTLATYTPTANFNGQDSFTWTVSDGVATTTGTVTITVTPVNDGPTAGALSVTTDEDGGVTIPLAGNDVDDDVLSYSLGANAAHGTVVVAGATATYIPSSGWNGTDTFSYRASDGILTSAPATVTVRVKPINHAPSISAILLQTTAGSPVSTTLDVTDADGDPVAISAVSTPQHGSVTHSGLTLTYTPATRSGTETFFVTVSDAKGATATAQVGVEISARTAQVTLSSPEATRGTRSTVTVTASGPAGPTPTGTVTLTSGGTTLGTSEFGADGTATVAVRPRKAGMTAWVASYAGDSLFGPTTSPPASVTVARSRARLRFSADKLRRGRSGVVKVRVRTVAGVAATGKVKLKVGSQKLTAKTIRGVAKFKIAKLPHKTKLKVSARYSGDTQYARSRADHRYRLRR